MNEIANLQKCIQMRSGVEIWIDVKKADALMTIIQERERTGQKGMFQFDGRLMNIADLVGIFMPSDMENSTRRKNGEWACQSGYWHAKGDKCDCTPRAEKELLAKRETAIKACGKCMSGWVMTIHGTVESCRCQAQFKA